MLTQFERDEMRVHFMNRFRNHSFEQTLEPEFTETKENKRLMERIRKYESAVRDAKDELYIARRAHRDIVTEERVRVAKKQLGVRETTEALIKEVYDRAQQVKKLRAEDVGWRSRRGGQYLTIRQFINSGTYGNRWNERDYHPLFVEHNLLSNALGVIGESTARKDNDLYERVRDHYMKVREEHIELGQPVDRKEAK